MTTFLGVFLIVGLFIALYLVNTSEINDHAPKKKDEDT